LTVPVTNHQANGRKGGRPALAATKVSRKKADELADSGRSPLDVMMDNMWFWFDRSREMETMLKEQFEELRANQGVLSAEELAEDRKRAFGLLATFLAARENAQKCAVDAAPYVHPRLQSIAFKPAPPKPPADGGPAAEDLSIQEAAEMYANLLRSEPAPV
jgi:hypothetical protein